MTTDEIKALLEGPETLDLLAFHLRNMADTAFSDQIDADRVSRAANVITALLLENAALAAWQCVHTDGKTGIVCDEYGNQYCAKDKAAADHALIGVEPWSGLLSDPNAVHVNMLRGTIAKPPLAQIIHIYGIDALCTALAPHIVREAENAPS